MKTRLVALLVALAVLALTACGGSQGGAVSAPSQAIGNIDINPQPRDNVRDGGDLRLPMEQIPNNFNIDQLDGASVDLGSIDSVVLPMMFLGTPDGGLRVDTDFLTSAAITSTAPQVVTYTINPKANWSDGTPITWRDFQANWQALNGRNPAYEVSYTNGFDHIGSVTRGADDKQVLVTFARPYAEWENLFSPLMPASAMSTPAAFNTSWKTGIPITAGPFTIDSIDQVNQTVTIKRDPRWWGTPAKLDRIIFRVYEPTAEPDALANNELDYFDIGANLDSLRRAQKTPGVVVRNAPSREYSHLDLNGASGSPLADLRLRQAIAQGVNRQEITTRMIGQIVPNAVPDGNHLYVPGTKDYRDNSGVLPYDPAHTQQVLDSLGWARRGNTRVKDGKPLSLRLVYAQDPGNQNIAQSVQNELGELGVTVVLQPYPPNEFFPAIKRGNFDMTLFVWQGVANPLSTSVAIYGRPIGNNVRENYARVGTPEIDTLFAKGTSELDDTKRADIGNQIDRLIWQEAHSVVLYARPGAVAERANLANFGASGFADTDYIDAGFMK
ncbi:MAG TPA: ABC transporter family substrate-binding protein [Pseudonocardia sp.]|uniref:ABC transporter family substrate-binding protein n=1 Tax=Pseudonocardia sp. TaxID=60912 RepID=UPI002F3F5388